ncbi:MAG: hypothetical protein QME21_17440 [Anaerolineales bacterium]|nr:hypothetical protein [Anaerolineales bacterium]
MTALSDLLLQRIANLGRMLAGCALAWPDEVLDATQNLTPDCFTDPRAQRFIAALRGDENYLPDPLSERILTVWLENALLAVPEGAELNIQGLAHELAADWLALEAVRRLELEQSNLQVGVQR